ncbi:MAG: hypothetical protein ACI9H6_000763 [Patiriisocius sp.]|jgi:hypothetical protein
MNTTTNSFTLMRTAENTRDRLIYGIYFVVGLFFGFAGIFTLLKSATILANIANLPLIVLPVVFLYIYVQLLLSYGFLYCRKWILPVVAIHIGYTVATIGLILPYFGLQHLMYSSAVAAIPFLFILAFVTHTRDRCTGKLVSYVAIISYSIALALLIAINTVTGSVLG